MPSEDNGIEIGNVEGWFLDTPSEDDGGTLTPRRRFSRQELDAAIQNIPRHAVQFTPTTIQVHPSSRDAYHEYLRSIQSDEYLRSIQSDEYQRRMNILNIRRTGGSGMVRVTPYRHKCKKDGL